jgi:hypothetical protein
MEQVARMQSGVGAFAEIDPGFHPGYRVIAAGSRPTFDDPAPGGG